MNFMSHIILVLFLMISLIQEVLTKYCGDIFCDASYKCCADRDGCCFDRRLHANKHLRLQIWNMWYFWFLIIFMMMSCFGGCGYYRRRRLALLSGSGEHTANVNVNRPVTVLATQRRVQRVHRDRNRSVDMYTYTGPGLNLTVPTTTLPPPYSEVVSQPGLYPVNKCELPPYPGDKPDHSMQGVSPAPVGVPPSSDTTLPPPYSEQPPNELTSTQQHTHQLSNGLSMQTTSLPSNTNAQYDYSGTSEQGHHPV